MTKAEEFWRECRHDFCASLSEWGSWVIGRYSPWVVALATKSLSKESLEEYLQQEMLVLS